MVPWLVWQRWLMIREKFFVWTVEGRKEGGRQEGITVDVSHCSQTLQTFQKDKSISLCPHPLSLNDILFLSYCIHLLPCLIYSHFLSSLGFPGGSMVKKSSHQGKRYGFGPWSWKILCSTTWRLTPVVLPGNFHGQSSLAGYSLRGCRVGPGWAHTHFPPYP